VRPTRRGVGLFISGFAALVAAHGFGAPALAPLGVGLIVLPLIAYLVVAIAAHGLTVTRTLDPIQPRAGENLDVRGHVEARGLGRLLLRVLEWPVALGTDALGPTGRRQGSRTASRIAILSARRGEHRLPAPTVTVSDPFALAEAVRHGLSTEVLVPPATVALGDTTRAWALRGLTGGHRDNGEDFSSLEGVRDYRAGDPLSRVHWGQSAKRGRLQTKQFHPTTAASPLAIVVLDVSAPPADSPVTAADFELAVVIAASIVRVAGDGAHLWITDASGPVAGTWAAHERALARVCSGGGRPASSGMRPPGPARAGALAVVTAWPDAAALEIAAPAGRETVLVLAGSVAARAPVAPRTGVVTIRVPDESAIASMLATPGRRRTVSRV
jgi:uncharacterized protein (DUF58 family)